MGRRQRRQSEVEQERKKVWTLLVLLPVRLFGEGEQGLVTSARLTGEGIDMAGIDATYLACSGGDQE